MKTWQILLLSLSGCLGDGVFDRLHDDIFHDHRYNPHVIPMRNPNEPLKVNIQLSLLDLEMDRKGSPLEANVWVAMEWEDYRLTWDPVQYEGLKTLNVPAKHLWTPDIEILNAYNFDAKSFAARMETKPGRAIMSSNGTIIWFPSNLLEVHCDEASPLDKEDEERRCSISVGSWSHMATQIQLDAYKGNDFLDLEDFKKGSEFVLTSQRGSALTRENYQEWGDYIFLKYEFKLIKSYVKDPQGNYLVNPNLQSSLEDIYTAYKAKDSFVSDKFEGKCSQNFMEALTNGANDVIVVKRKNGNLESTSWKGQVGKFYLIGESREGKTVSVIINDVSARIRMSICDNGELIFSRANKYHHMASVELRELNLQPGVNKAKYVVDNMGIVIDFNVFLYNEDDKLIITDVDGTITESDIKGQTLPQFGITADHKSVVELFHKISQNGYKLVYLTARSMSQHSTTRWYLFTMLQNLSGFSLPPGPVIFSPVPFFTGLYSEVVSGTPHIEKSKSINDMNQIFLNDTIVGAYGNKDTDTTAYKTSGIPLRLCWIVNPAGVLKNEATELITSYTEQARDVDTLYPKLNSI